MTTFRHPSGVAPLALVVLTIIVAACASGVPAGSPAPTPGATPDASAPAPTPVPGSTDGGTSSVVPGAPGSDGPISGGGSDPDTGSGTGGDPGIVDPGEPQPTIVTPGAGLAGVHPVGATTLDTATNGRDLAVRVSWWSGVEPCNVLAGVDVVRDGTTFKLTVREGSAAAPDTACIEIAQYKATIVDLGELEPGTYTITAFGDAATGHGDDRLTRLGRMARRQVSTTSSILGR